MATIKRFPNGTYQCIVTDKRLPKPYYKTFKTEAEAIARGDEIDRALDAGGIPADLIETHAVRAQRQAEAQAFPHLLQVINEYTAARAVTDSDEHTYRLVLAETGNPRINEITLEWAEKLVARYKSEEFNHAPSTIRKRIEALSRALRWHEAKTSNGRDVKQSLGKLLGRGYSHHTEGEKRDVKRDRLFQEGEEAQVRAVFSGMREIPAISERSLRDPQLEMLFDLIVNTGLRLREAYTLHVNQVQFENKIIRVNGTQKKGASHGPKVRNVPMRKAQREALKRWIDANELKPADQLFTYWDGNADKAEMKKCSTYLSGLFRSLFAAAGVADMREHDLRHEAAVRWTTLKRDGQWIYSPAELMEFMGWETMALLRRYIKGWRPDVGNALGDDL